MRESRSIPVPLLLFLICVVVSILAGKTTRRVPTRSKDAREESFFVCLTSARMPLVWKAALAFLDTASNPTAVRIGIVLFVSDVNAVYDAHEWHHPQISVRRQAAHRTDTLLCKGRRLCVRHLHHCEKYILFANDTYPLAGWDAWLLSHMPMGHVVVALSNKAGMPCFPTLRSDADSVAVRAKPFALTRDCVTMSTVWCHSFACFPSALLTKCDLFHESQINQTSLLWRHGIACHVACAALCRGADQHWGLKPNLKDADLDVTGCGKYPQVGVVASDDSRELIVKYGNIDTARVVIALCNQRSP